jgi:isoleucyl-tRNA synthetase
LISKLNVLIQEVTTHLNNYDPYESALAIENFVEALSTWYIRRSRRRFWKSEKDKDKNAAYTTLYSCLTTLATLLAPFIPFVTEEIHQNLESSINSMEFQSIHHKQWPKYDNKLINKKLITDMDLTIKICSLGRSARNKAGIKLRQPLLSATIVAEKSVLNQVEKLKKIIVDELNVKNLYFTTKRKAISKYVVKPLPQILGKKYGKMFPEIQKTLSKIDPNKIVKDFEEKSSIALDMDGKKVKILREEIEILTCPIQNHSLSEDKKILVAIETFISDDLKREGLAKDIVRNIQNLRKKAGFNIADYIDICYDTGEELSQVFKEYEDYISLETLSKTIRKTRPNKKYFIAELKIKDENLKIGLKRIETQEKQ